MAEKKSRKLKQELSCLEEEIEHMRLQVALWFDSAILSIEISIVAKLDWQSKRKGKLTERHLFQPEDGSNLIFICDLKSKQIRQKFVDFKLPTLKAFCIVKDDSFFAGG